MIVFAETVIYKLFHQQPTQLPLMLWDIFNNHVSPEALGPTLARGLSATSRSEWSARVVPTETSVYLTIQHWIAAQQPNFPLADEINKPL